MSDPNRLLETDNSQLARTLLAAAREERPSNRAIERTLLAVSAGAAVMGAAAAAGGAGAGSAAGSSGASVLGGIVKWLGIGAVSGLITAGAATQLAPSGDPEPEAAPPPRVLPSEPPPARAVVRAPPAHEPAEPEPAPQPSRSSVRPSSRAAEVATPPIEEVDPSLNAEVAALDRARTALSGGDPARALSELEGYDRQFSGGKMSPEALYLRMEASEERGDRAAAQAAARELLARHPRSPHAARARQLLSGR
jgi:hypothetical protein